MTLLVFFDEVNISIILVSVGLERIDTELY